MTNKTKFIQNISEVIDVSQYEEINGELQYHFETGMEGIGLLLYRNDPKFLTRNEYYNGSYF